MIKYLKNLIQTVCWFALLVLLFFLEKFKKKLKKKNSENDQLTGHFQSFFILFFRPPDPKSEKNSRKSTN